MRSIRKYITVFFAIMSICIMAQSSGSSWWNTDYNTTEGTEFWLTFMSNSGAAEGDEKDMKLFLYATAREDAQVTISNPNINEAPIILNVSAAT